MSHFHLAWYQAEYRSYYPKYHCYLTATENTENRFIGLISLRTKIIFSDPYIKWH
jgi:hypothetical protein